MRAAVVLAVAALGVSACDELPEPASAAPKPSATSVSFDPASATPLVDESYNAASLFASRCVIQDLWTEPSRDICTHIDHCLIIFRANKPDFPCGYSDSERDAAVAVGEKAGKLLSNGEVRGALATYLFHVKAFGDRVARTTDVATCLKNDRLHDGYCFENTRGTLAAFQTLARAYVVYTKKEASLVPETHRYAIAPPYHKIGKKTRLAGLPWGKCPGGPCIVEDQAQPKWMDW